MIIVIVLLRYLGENIMINVVVELWNTLLIVWVLWVWMMVGDGRHPVKEEVGGVRPSRDR